MEIQSVPKYLFFAAAKRQRTYFNQLVGVSTESKVVWYKSIPVNIFKYKNHGELTEFIKQELIKSENTRGKAYIPLFRHLLKIYLTVYAKNLYKRYYDLIAQTKPKTSVVWNGLKFRQQIWCLAAKELGVRLRFMENGLVKGYTTLDRQGVNFGNSLPRESAFYRNQIAHVSEFQPIEADPKSINLPKRFIFVPFQVNGDSQVICYSHWVKNMSHMADILIECAPELKEKDVSIVVKPHPNCSTPNDELLNHLLSNNITVVKDIDSKVLVSLAEAVVTINSTVGLEALEAGKKVIVLGQAFYNIPDMVLSANSLSELKACFKKLSGWEPDARAVQGLFHYLRNTYQIKGNWREADQEHLNMCLEKLDEMDAE